MKQTKPAQAMELRSLSPVLGGLMEVRGRMPAWLANGLRLGCVAGFLVGGGHLLIADAAWRPWGAATLLMFSTYGVMAAGFGAPIIVCLGLASIPFRRTRTSGATMAVAGTVFLPLVVLGIGLGWRAHEAGQRRLVTHGDVIVDAVLRYEADSGHPPATLEELVPRYLAELPTTGSGAFDEWRYTPDTDKPGGRWHLSVYTGSIVFDWEHVSYNPTGAYLPYGVRMIGRWAVVNP